MFRNSSGTRSDRSASFCPATSDHRAAAPARATASSARCAETPGWPSAEREPALRGACRCGRTRRAGADGFRSSSGSGPRSMVPSSTSEIIPFSSDTTTATESFSSVRPIAARCRDPELTAQARIHGQRQEAGGRSDPIVVHDDRAVVQVRFRVEDASPAGRSSPSRRGECRPRCSCAARSRRSIAMIAPTRRLASMPAATAISSTASSAAWPFVRSRKNGARPKCASARRISDWNSTMAANTT